jgi:hypothetical protein
MGDVVLTPGFDIPRENREALAAHEARHRAQWAVATVIGGPLALPIAYAIDDFFFPGSRNHFERQAGLETGGYTSSGTGPVLGPAQLAVLSALAAIIVLAPLAVRYRRAAARSRSPTLTGRARAWRDHRRRHPAAGAAIRLTSRNHPGDQEGDKLGGARCRSPKSAHIAGQTATPPPPTITDRERRSSGAQSHLVIRLRASGGCSWPPVASSPMAADTRPGARSGSRRRMLAEPCRSVLTNQPLHLQARPQTPWRRSAKSGRR